MGKITRFQTKFVLRVIAWPKLTLALCLLTLALSIFLAMTRLKLSTDQNDLMSPSQPFFKDYLHFIQKFPENEAILVVVRPRDPQAKPPAARWAAIADALGTRLQQMPGDVKRVDWRVPLEKLGDQGLLFAPHEEVKQNTKEFSQLTFALTPNVLTANQPLAGRMFTTLALGGPDRSYDPALALMQSLDAALKADPKDWRERIEKPSLAALDPRSKTDPSQLGYFYLAKQNALLINVYQNRDYTSLAEIAGPVNNMRAAVAEVAKKYPEFHVVLTGRPVLEADEMTTTDRDTKIAEILGLSLVFVTLLFLLRSLWLAFVAEICLAVAIGWTFGWATLTVGRLNLLSLVFVIALIGIGIDYLIQVLSRYRHEKQRYTRPSAIWSRVFRHVSPPITTACCGAAGAFLVAALTDFKGAAELGIIAGGGLFLCLLSGYTLAPALLTLWPASVRVVEAEQRYASLRDVPRISWRSFIVPALWLFAAGAGLLVGLPLKFDPDLLKLQARHLESVQAVRDLPTWSMVVLTDNLEDLSLAREKLRGAATVGRTESILDATDNHGWLTKHSGPLRDFKLPPTPPATSQQLTSVQQSLDAIERSWSAKLNDNHRHQLSQTIASIKASAASPEALARFNAWQQAFATDIQNTVAQFAPPPFDPARIPVEVRDHLVSTVDGRKVYALYVWPKNDDLWATHDLSHFVHEVESRLAGTPNITVTGIAHQLLYSTQYIHRAFLLATLYALSLIVILVWLDVRKFSQTLLAISVLALGLPVLLLCMWLWQKLGDPFEIPGTFNFANFFALPILMGAGHEYGVFMVHRYREVLADPRRVWRPWDVSDRALLLCAIATSCAFGFLTIGHHKGLASLGWVMAAGTACIYFATIFVVRPILLWRIQHKGIYDKAFAAADNKR